MSTIHQILRHCNDLVCQSDYRKGYLEGIQGKYRGLTGCFSNYIPEEIVAAAAFHPVRIIGTYPSLESCRRTLFNPACSFVQDVYAAARSGGLSHFSNIIFPNSCDSLKMLWQMWENETSLPPAYTLLHPVKTDLPAIEYFAFQIQMLADWLREKGGRDFSREDLFRSVNTYNRTRNLLRRMYDIRFHNPEFLSGSDMTALMTAGLIMDRDEYNQCLSQVIQGAEKQKDAAPCDLKRIMVIGPLFDNIELLRKIERLGACIIADEVTNGSRYFDLDIETEGDLYSNLARRYLLSGPSPTLNTETDAVLESFQKKVESMGLQGVLFITQKFCEPHVHHYLARSEVLRRMKVPCLLLEIEHGQQDIPERDLLRVESFFEIAGLCRS